MTTVIMAPGERIKCLMQVRYIHVLYLVLYLQTYTPIRYIPSKICIETTSLQRTLDANTLFVLFDLQDRDNLSTKDTCFNPMLIL